MPCINWDDSAENKHALYEEAIASTSDQCIINPSTVHATPLMIMYTAGTTGHPKGVLITHGMMLYNAINITHRPASAI